jgi:DNA repair exonuclease SbcCD ATPase subunit
MLEANIQEENLSSPESALPALETPAPEVSEANETQLLQLGLEQNEIQEAVFQADDLEANLPYLFNNRKGASAPSGQPLHQGGHGGLSAQSIVNQVMMFAEPVGDAVVPGGAAQSPDTETLKKYLLLREQDVAVLSNQLKSAREQVLSLDKKLKEANGQILELKHVVSEQQRRIEEGDQGAERLVEGLQKENEELHFQAKAKTDKVKVMEAQVKAASDEVENLKERVRTDIRKIRVREKELANKLEIMRRDSEALIASRESKIIELKRKVDLLEFNLDLLQDQYSREKENSAQLRERLGKAAQVVRVAGGLLDPSDDGPGGRDRNSASGKGEIQSASKVREIA